MGIIDNFNAYPGGFVTTISLYFLRFFQLILAIAVIGLYAQDLNRAHHEGKYTDSNWVYAVVVSTLSAILSLCYIAIPPITRAFFSILWPLDAILCILWIALFGDFGAKYIHADPQNVGHGDGPGIQRMKNAVWVDLTCMLLWLVTAVWGTMWFCMVGRRRTLHTGRAEM
jgi:occludin/MAL family lipid-associated protein